MNAFLAEMIVDSFAGGGGASTGIEMALGRSPDVAINHDDAALAMHAANHPATVHLSNNIWKVDPDDVEPRRPIGLLWASPDCTHHSKAKGGVPIRAEGRNSRDLGWIVVLWAERRRPRVIILENVEEWVQWGPLVPAPAGGFVPDPERRGHEFQRWVKALKRLGYRVEWREMRACDYGAPTTRKRLFVIARRDGRPIVWPAPTHGDPKSAAVIAGKLKSWRTAAEIIDWSLPCPSIFLTKDEARAWRVKRPLAEATMARIARGVKRYVLDAAEPFIVPVTHAGDLRCNPVGEPLRTQTTAHRGEHALITPFVTKFRQNSIGHRLDEPLHTVTAAHSETHPGGACPLGLVAPLLVPRYGERPGQAPRSQSVGSPLATVVPTANGAQIVAAFLAQHNTGVTGHDLRKPISTVVAGGEHGQSQQALCAAHLLNLKGRNRRDGPIDAPAPTVCANGNHAALVASFLMKYYGEGGQWQGVGEPLHTITTKDRAALVTVTIAGEPYILVDIGMRMLTPRERFLAQGFPSGYRIDIEFAGRPLSGEAKGRMVGNSVCPPHAAALVAANVPELAA